MRVITKYCDIILKLFCIVLILNSCERIKIDRINKATTGANSNQNNYLIIQSALLDFATDNNIKYGHCIGLNQYPDIISKVSDYTGNQRIIFSDTLTDLVHNQLYYYRPYIKNDAEITYGETSSFIAVFNPEVVSFSSFQASVLEYNKMMFACILDGKGSFSIESYGYMLRNSTRQTEWITSEYNGLYPDLYSDTVNGIIAGDIYELKIFIKPANYVKVLSETFQITINLLQVTTGSHMLLNNNSVRLYGEIIKGSLPVNDHGFCYSYTNSNPDLNDMSFSLGENTNQQFHANITNLAPNLTYYYRAYGMEDNRITYGDIEQFIITE